MSNIILTTNEELSSLIQSIVRKEVERATPQPPETYLDSIQVAELLQVSKVTLSDWRKKKIIPFKKVGTRIRYLRSEIEQFMSTRKKYGRNGQ